MSIADNSSYSLEDLLVLMERLRDPVDGCPWDREQTFSSIVPHTIEECYELADAIAQENFAHIKEELGDVLFQVVFYAQLGGEQGHFSFADVVSTLVDKLLRRHPHVFPLGTLQSRSAENVISSEKIHQNWELIKSGERKDKRQSAVLDDIPIALPALTRAVKMQKRSARVGFDWDSIEGVLHSCHAELEELVQAKNEMSIDEIEDELGDVLFSVANLARHLKVDPESALRRSNRKFEARFRYIETALEESGSTPQQASIEQMDDLWDEAKSRGL